MVIASQPRAWPAPKSRGHRPGPGRGPAPSEGDFNQAQGTDTAGNSGQIGGQACGLETRFGSIWVDSSRSCEQW